MSKKHISIIKKKHRFKYPLGYSNFTGLSGSARSKKHRLSYSPSEFHQSPAVMVGVFYKPSAIILNDFDESN